MYHLEDIEIQFFIMQSNLKDNVTNLLLPVIEIIQQTLKNSTIILLYIKTKNNYNASVLRNTKANYELVPSNYKREF